MKKTYIAPTVEVVPVKMTQAICITSVKSNVEFEWGEDTPDGFTNDDIR